MLKRIGFPFFKLSRSLDRAARSPQENSFFTLDNPLESKSSKVVSADLSIYRPRLTDPHNSSNTEQTLSVATFVKLARSFVSSSIQRLSPGIFILWELNMLPHYPARLWFHCSWFHRPARALFSALQANRVVNKISARLLSTFGSP